MPTDLVRRRLLALGLGTLAFGAAAGLRPGMAAQSAPASLKDAARRRGLRYGSDSDVTIEHAPKPYGALFAQQCDLYAGNLSWKTLTPQPGTSDPAREDPNIPFAYAHDIEVTGGHLIWHESIPDWVKALSEPSDIEKAIDGHIEAMATHYSGKVYSWNVVNEGINPKEGRPDGLRHHPILKALGPGYIDFAFRAARKAMPGVLLVYNDFNMEMDRPDHEARRRALLALLDSFKRDGTPVDAIGLQSHIHMDGSTFTEQIYRSFLDEISSRGFKIMITELDVLDLATPSDIAARDQAVADLYRRFLSVALDETAVISVVNWGLSDRYTWMTPDRSASYARADGMPVRPLPFDDWFQPKPAFDAIMAALIHAPARKAA